MFAELFILQANGNPRSCMAALHKSLQVAPECVAPVATPIPVLLLHTLLRQWNSEAPMSTFTPLRSSCDLCEGRVVIFYGNVGGDRIKTRAGEVNVGKAIKTGRRERRKDSLVIDQFFAGLRLSWGC